MNKYQREGRQLFAQGVKAKDLPDTIELVKVHADLGIISEAWVMSAARDTYVFNGLEVVNLAQEGPIVTEGRRPGDDSRTVGRDRRW